MKLAFFDDFKLGIVVGDKIIDVSSVTKGSKALGPQEMIRTVIEKWSAYKSKLAAAAKKGKGMPLSKVKLRPPLPKPENIVCMAVNYMEDGTLSERAPINAFMKSRAPSSATAALWCCRIWRPVYSRARRNSPWSSAGVRHTSRRLTR